MTIGYGNWNWISLHSTSVFASQCTVFVLDSFGVCRHVGRRVVLEVWEHRSLWDVTNWYKLAQKPQKHLIWIWPRILETSRVMHELQKSQFMIYIIHFWTRCLAYMMSFAGRQERIENRLFPDLRNLKENRNFATLQIAIAASPPLPTPTITNQLAEVLFSGSWQPWLVSAVQVLQHFSCPLDTTALKFSGPPLAMFVHAEIEKSAKEKNVMISLKQSRQTVWTLIPCH